MAIDFIRMTYQGTTLTFPVKNNKIYVPIKEVCDILEINEAFHLSWLQNVEYFQQSVKMMSLCTTCRGRHRRCIRDIDALAWLSWVARKEERSEAVYAFMAWLRDQVEGIYYVPRVFSGLG